MNLSFGLDAFEIFSSITILCWLLKLKSWLSSDGSSFLKDAKTSRYSKLPKILMTNGHYYPCKSTLQLEGMLEIMWTSAGKPGVRTLWKLPPSTHLEILYCASFIWFYAFRSIDYKLGSCLFYFLLQDSSITSSCIFKKKFSTNTALFNWFFILFESSSFST